MLKFRMTNSMRARRALEAQRKALEDKIKMEWAWMPMAARMNEKATDLVYWVPPIYNSPLLSSTVSSTVTKPIRGSLRRTSTFRRSSSVCQQKAYQKRRLANRRAKLKATESVLKDMELDDDKEETEENIENDVDSGTEVTGEHFEDKSVYDDRLSLDLPFPEVQTVKLVKKPSLKDAQTASPKRLKFKQIPALLKTVEKFNEIRNKSKTPPKLQKKTPSTSKRKPKRPSMKIYPVLSQRSFYGKQKKQLKLQRCTMSSLAKGCVSIGGSLFLENGNVKLPKRKHSSNSHVQCRMMCAFLTQYCEKKLSEQSLEIALLKAKITQQEKVLKHTAELALDLKSHFININTRLVSVESHHSRPPRREDSHPPYYPLQSVNEETTEDTSTFPTSVNETVSMHTSMKRASWKKRHMWPHRNLCISESMDSADTLKDVPDIFRTSLRIQLSENGS